MDRNHTFPPNHGPIDYGLDHCPFKAKNRVRVSVGLPETRKLDVKKKMPKERNPMVRYLMSRSGSGVHGKSVKAIRRDTKVKVLKELTE